LFALREDDGGQSGRMSKWNPDHMLSSLGRVLQEVNVVTAHEATMKVKKSMGKKKGETERAM
jgi:hypothetical protein